MKSAKVQKKNRKPVGTAFKTMWLVKAYCRLAETFHDELYALMEQGEFSQTSKAAEAITREIKKRSGDPEDTYICHTLEPALKLSSLYERDHCTDIESAVVELPFMGLDCKPLYSFGWDMECVRVFRDDGTDFKIPVLDVIPVKGRRSGA